MSARAPTVYVASKSKYGPLWQSYRQSWADLGLRIISTWIDESGEGESGDLGDLWVRCISEAASADFLVALHCGSEAWKGAYIEIGVALAARKPVYVVGSPPGSFIHHPLVTIASTPDDAIEDWRAFHFEAEWPAAVANRSEQP